MSDPPETPVVLYLGEGEEQQQLEIIQPYVQHYGCQVIAMTRDIHTALRMVEEGTAARIIAAGEEYMAVPPMVIVTRDFEQTQDANQRRPRRLRRPEDPPTGR